MNRINVRVLCAHTKKTGTLSIRKGCLCGKSFYSNGQNDADMPNMNGYVCTGLSSRKRLVTE